MNLVRAQLIKLILITLYLFKNIVSHRIVKMAAPSNINKFLTLSQYNPELKRSRLVCCDEFVGDYQSLENKNGGGWCRLDGTFGKKYKAFTVKKNGDIKYSWNVDLSERDEIHSMIPELEGKGNGIHYIMIYGEQNLSAGRPIGQSIRDALCKKPCVSCGSNSNIEIDHKNGLYNDPRVLNVQTQTVDDFQPLCKHCNDQKRQTYKKMKDTGIRHSACDIPCLEPLGFDYVGGGTTYDINNPNTMVGTYWYDPVAFMKYINSRII